MIFPSHWKSVVFFLRLSLKIIIKSYIVACYLPNRMQAMQADVVDHIVLVLSIKCEQPTPDNNYKINPYIFILLM